MAAGFAPLGIGTETGGSNVFPASVNGLYGLTLPLGTVPMDGIFRISETFDRVGLMARDPHDLVSLCNILLKADAKPQEFPTEGAIPARSLWEGLSIGVLDSEWGTDPTSKWKWGSAEVVRSARKPLSGGFFQVYLVDPAFRKTNTPRW